MRLLESYDCPATLRTGKHDGRASRETGLALALNVLPEKITRGVRAPAIHTSPDGVRHSRSGVDLEQQIQDMEKVYIEEQLRMSDGVGTRAAELLRMTYRSFRHYLRNTISDFLPLNQNGDRRIRIHLGQRSRFGLPVVIRSCGGELSFALSARHYRQRISHA